MERTPNGSREGEKEEKGWEGEGRRQKKDKGGNNQGDQEERRHGRTIERKDSKKNEEYDTRGVGGGGN